MLMVGLIDKAKFFAVYMVLKGGELTEILSSLESKDQITKWL